MLSFSLSISHSQVAVFNSELINPFNGWSDIQVRQGFSWRSGSVSFKTLDTDGALLVSFNCIDKYVPVTGAIRAISVPFECSSSGKIEIASISDAQEVPLEPGLYQLIFETGQTDGPWCRISFLKDGNLNPNVLIQDSGLDPVYPLDMSCGSI